jgi:hypothetical protein
MLIHMGQVHHSFGLLMQMLQKSTSTQTNVFFLSLFSPTLTDVSIDMSWSCGVQERAAKEPNSFKPLSLITFMKANHSNEMAFSFCGPQPAHKSAMTMRL